MLDFAQVNMSNCKSSGSKYSPHFMFPEPLPTLVAPSFFTPPNTTSDSDSPSDSSCTRCRPRQRPKRLPINESLRASQSFQSCSPKSSHALLPPIGVFWDIENCNVPKGCSAVLVAQVIRDSFFDGYREAEFLVVCDVTKESSRVVEELNDAQVNLIHVPSLHKNAADEKLRQSMRRFADLHGSPAAVILITGDINFIADVCDLRHRHKLRVILLHRENTSEALIRCANENHNIVMLFKALPQRSEKQETGSEPHQLLVYDLPRMEVARIKNRLKRISENCGGRVLQVFTDGSAALGFTSRHLADRAAKRMDGADVFGNKISVGEPARMDQQVATNQQARWPTLVPAPVGNTRWKSPDLMPPPTVNAATNRVQAVNKSQPIAGKPIPIIQGRRLTPSPYGGSRSDSWENPRSVTPNSLQEDPERYFHPISAGNTPNAKHELIELQITNLDQSILMQDMKKILMNAFSEHVQVVHLSVFVQSDGQLAAHIKLGSLQEAQYAISQLHRRKVGHRRMAISYASSPSGPSPQLVRAQIVALLQEIPTHTLPLFKFCELFESRYLTSISVSDVYKMRDVCLIVDDDRTGRTISLNRDHRQTPSPANQDVELAYCALHTQQGHDKGWAEQEVNTLPCVRIGLKLLTCRIHSLVQAHKGSVPLPSLARCYEAQFSALEADDSGVPLEHLLSCLPGVEITQGLGSVKYLRWAQQPDNDEPGKCVSPPLAAQQTLFAREVVDLLKTSPHCLLPFNRFIPAYHHHYGRQCRVADYGYVKLMDLLEALGHIVQVLGEGNRRVLTLSHRAQVRRFTSDLLRLLKAQASKQVALSEFAAAYHRHMGKEWDIVDYGVCDLADLLSEVSQTTVSVSRLDNDVIISIPKREQTQEEAAKTQQFAIEVVELLSHAPQCKLQFNKFIPAYHHHFGRQCRLADYGHTKLVELFESIPQAVKLLDGSDGERQVSLTTSESLRVLTSQLSSLLSRGGLLLEDIQEHFKHMFGFGLKPETYGCRTMMALMKHLPEKIQISYADFMGPMVSLVDKPDGLSNSIAGFQNMMIDLAPKPDSPLKMNWNASLWFQATPRGFSGLNNYLGLPIELPPSEAMVDPSTTNLTSPTKSLLEAHEHPISAYVPLNIVAPDASSLPMPTKLGAEACSNGLCDVSVDSSGSSTPSKVQRKPRLAAHFSSPLGN